jgi:hypothetical protein
VKRQIEYQEDKAMDDLENRRRQMFWRVDGFGIAHSADFAANSVARQLFTNLADVVVAQLDEHAAAQVSGFGAAHEATSSRAVTRQALLDALRAIARTAEAIAHDTPGFDDKFRMPPQGNDSALLNVAHSFAANAAPVSARFISHELPADFLADLNTDIANFEAAIRQHSSSVATHVSAGASIDELIADGLVIVKKLDAIVRNKYADDAAILAEWTSASHTERSPKKQSAAPSPTPPPPPPHVP